MRTALPLLAALALLLPAAAWAEGEGGAPAPAPAPAAKGEPPPPIRTLRLSLKEAVATALRSNLDLRASSYGPPVAATLVDEAESLYDYLFVSRVNGGESITPVPSTLAGQSGTLDEDFLGAGAGVQRLLPTGGTLSLDATADRTLTNSAYVNVNPYYETRVGLNLRQPLLRDAGRDVTESGIRLAKDEKDLADLELRARTEELVREVEAGFWLVAGARGDVEARVRSVTVAEDLLRVNTARLDAGAGTKVEVSQASAGLAARRVDLLRAENTLRILEERLLGLLFPRGPGAFPREDLRFEPGDDPVAALGPRETGDPDAVLEEALLARSDVRAAKVAVDQAEVAVLRAESESLVRLDLQAGLSYGGLDGNLGQSYADSMASREFPTWSVGLVLEVPLGNRAARARLERAVLLRARAEARVKALESGAAVAVRNSRRELESTREQIDAAREATRLSEEQLQAERDRLENGKSTTFEVLRLEGDLTDARRSELRALVEYLAAVARHDFEAGRILERRGLVPAPPAR